jgi:hypothetical protein
MLVKTERMNMLLDFYENLLTEKQRDIMKLYYREDLSLQEIAEFNSTSRSAVHDLLKRCEKILEDYDDKLQLVKKYQKRNNIYKDMLKLEDETLKVLVYKCIEIENMED